MKTTWPLLIFAGILASPTVSAQTPPPSPPAAPQAPVAVTPAGPVLLEEAGTPPQLVNIRVDIVISEQGGSDPPVKKTATVITADRRAAAVRATGEAEVPNSTGRRFPNQPERMTTYAKADVRPWVEQDGRIRTLITLEYLSPTSQADGRGTQLKLEPLLESGKPLLASRSTDPTSDRTIGIEVTATILK